MLDLTPDEWIAIRLSLRIALVATAASLPFGLAIAWLLARKDFWGKAVVDGIVHLPLVLPPVVTGAVVMLIGLNLGPNVAVSGSLSAYLWFKAARSAGARPSALRFTRCSCVRPGVRSRAARASRPPPTTPADALAG